jgi:16S rRNA G1207 methylase RsmC
MSATRSGLQKPEMSQRLDALFDLGAGYGQIAARCVKRAAKVQMF